MTGPSPPLTIPGIGHTKDRAMSYNPLEFIKGAARLVALSQMPKSAHKVSVAISAAGPVGSLTRVGPLRGASIALVREANDGRSHGH